MRLERFRGPDLASVGAQARRAFGDDVMIVHTRIVGSARRPLIEVTAAAADEVQRFTARLTPGPLPTRGRTAAGPRPSVIALVGPTGAGKTTTVAKLAVHPIALGTLRAGMITLDTFRAGALEQLGMYAEVAGIPLEIAYDAADVAGALDRLQHCDVIIVDTPGRSPRTDRRRGDANARVAHWRTLLDAIAPDEVHLVLPATVRSDIATGVRDAFDADGNMPVTHLLLTKLDEVPDEAGVAELASAISLPARWVADGQEIPADLAVGAPRILRSLGVTAGDATQDAGSDERAPSATAGVAASVARVPSAVSGS
jgi:flagellar biosynthesis protein FlhF